MRVITTDHWPYLRICSWTNCSLCPFFLSWTLHRPFPAPSFPCTVLSLRHPFPTPSFPCTVLSLHCPFPAPSFPCTVLSLHCPFPALSFPYTVLSLHCPFPTLSFPCTILSLHHPFPALSFPYSLTDSTVSPLRSGHIICTVLRTHVMLYPDPLLSTSWCACFTYMLSCYRNTISYLVMSWRFQTCSTLIRFWSDISQWKLHII